MERPSHGWPSRPEGRNPWRHRHRRPSPSGKTPPLLVARAGRDNPWLNATIDRFMQEALVRNAALELMTHPTGEHGFDILNDDDRSREIIGRTLDFLKRHLDGGTEGR